MAPRRVSVFLHPIVVRFNPAEETSCMKMMMVLSYLDLRGWTREEWFLAKTVIIIMEEDEETIQQRRATTIVFIQII